MPKTRQQKEETLASLTEKIGAMKAVVFTKYSGLTVKDATDLRRTLRSSTVDFLIAKKTLIRRALTANNLDPSIVDNIVGETALAFGYQDEVLPAKLLATFAKDHPAIVLDGGIVNGTWIPAAGVVALAKLPSREELIAKTVWTIKAPLTGFVQVLSGNLRGLITVLSAIKDKQPA